MAVINVSCPKCATGYKIDEAHRGKKGKCKKCGATFLIGGAPAGSPAVAKERPRGEDGIPLDWEPGDFILDLYEVIKLPGTKHGYAEGGMGRVNLVRHREWQRDLAVKSVLPAKSASARDIENFKTEAEQWVDKIGLHPNIVACHYVRVLGGVPRVFIEYVDGGTLQEWLTSKRLYEGGPQAALERILDVAIQTAWGLHYVHDLGLIHQDVKPLNVMMTADGVAKVTDFGLAGARSVAFEANEQRPEGGTIEATWGGMTPAYCSPEQAEIAGKRAAGTPCERLPKLTRRSDVWSWAVSVLHMFLGKIAWPGGQVAHVALQRESDEPHLPGLPAGVNELLRTCLQKRPEDRPHDLMQVADTLQNIYEQGTGQSYPRKRPNPVEALADTLNNRAVSMIDLRKPEAALKLWEAALHANVLHPQATYNSGLVRWRKGELNDDVLLTNMRAVAQALPEEWFPLWMLANIDLERGDCEAALEALGQLNEVDAARAAIRSLRQMAEELRPGSRRCLRVFEGHTGEIQSVCLS